jgi:hypothetical protein
VDEHDTAGLVRLAAEIPEFYLLTRKRDVAEVESTLGRIQPLLESRIGGTDMVFALISRGKDRG